MPIKPKRTETSNNKKKGIATNQREKRGGRSELDVNKTKNN